MPNPKIDNDKCTGCFTCIDICPMDVFEKDEENKKAKVKGENECIGCKACEVQCPETVIKVNDD